MSQVVSREKYTFLRNEITRWEESNLLAPGQGASLLAQYKPADRIARMIGIVAFAGAILSGAGVLSLVAANLQHFALWWKLSALIVATIGLYVAGWRLKGGGTSPYVGEALILLACLLYGAGIWLIGQAFHLSAEPWFGILLWGIGVLPVAVAANSGLAASFSAFLLGCWMCSQHNDLLACCAAFAAAIIGGYGTRCFWPVAVAFGLTVPCLLRYATTIPYPLVLAGVAAFAIHVCHFHSARWHGFARPYLYASLAYTSFPLMVLCHNSSGAPDQIPAEAFSLIPYVVAGVLAALTLMVVLRRRCWAELLGCALMLFGVLGLCYLNGHDISHIVAGCLLAALLTAFTVYAVCVLESSTFVGIVLLIATSEVFISLTDQSWAAADRGWLFVACGLYLIASCCVLAWKRRAQLGAPEIQPSSARL